MPKSRPGVSRRRQGSSPLLREPRRPRAKPVDPHPLLPPRSPDGELQRQVGPPRPSRFPLAPEGSSEGPFRALLVLQQEPLAVRFPPGPRGPAGPSAGAGPQPLPFNHLCCVSISACLTTVGGEELRSSSLSNMQSRRSFAASLRAAGCCSCSGGCGTWLPTIGYP